MATIVNNREKILQDTSIGRVSRAPVQLYQPNAPQTNLFQNPDLLNTINITSTTSTSILDPFGTYAKSYVPNSTSAKHYISEQNINATGISTYVSGSKMQQTIYVKAYANPSSAYTKQLMGVLEARPTTTGPVSLFLRYKINPVSGQVSLITNDSGWSAYQGLSYALNNGWWKLVITGTFTSASYNIYSNWYILDGSSTDTQLSYSGDGGGIYLYGPQTYYGFTPDETISDVWIDSDLNTTKIWNGYSFLTTGGSTTTYYLSTTSSVLTKSSASPAEVGTYTSATISGYKNIGSTITAYGYFTVTANNGTENTTATSFASVSNSYTIQPATTAGTSSYTVKLYDVATVSPTVLKSTLVIPVVFAGASSSVYYLDSTSPVFTKDSDSAATTGNYSSATVYGKSVSGTTVTNPYGSYTVTPNTTTEPATVTAFGVNGVTISPAPGTSSYIVKLYSNTTSGQAASVGNLRDTLVIPVVFKGAPGSTSTSYYLEFTAPIFTKDSESAIATGNYSSVTAYGRELSGTTVSNYGYFTVTANNGTENTTATSFASVSNAYTIQPAAGTSSYTVKLYDGATVSTAVLKDTQVIPVVFKGAAGTTGADALTAVLTNDAAVIPTDSAGSASSGVYTAAGTSILVYEGNNALTYSPTTYAAGTVGTWTLSAPTVVGITANATTPSGSGTTTATYGAPSNMTADVGTITYNISARRTTGTTATLTKTQSFSKSKGGLGAITAVLTNDSGVIPTDSAGSNGVYTGSGTTIYVYEGGTALTYNGAGTTASTWKVTATGSSITASTIISGSGTTSAAYGDHAAMIADTATVTYTINGTRANTTAFTLTKTQTFSKSKSGVKGDTGSRSKTLNLYYSSPTKPTNVGNAGSWVPAINNTSTYSWSTDIHDTYNGTAWSVTPTADLVAGSKLWVASVNVVDPTGVAGSTVVNWPSIAPTLSQAGYSGNDGTKNGVIYIYQWSSGSSAPATPTTINQVYTWSTNTLSASTVDSWTTAAGTSSPGKTLWQGAYYLTGYAAGTAFTTISSWTGLVKSAIGYAGNDGVGTAGVSTTIAYARITGSAVPSTAQITKSGSVATAPVVGVNDVIDGAIADEMVGTTGATPEISNGSLYH